MRGPALVLRLVVLLMGVTTACGGRTEFDPAAGAAPSSAAGHGSSGASPGSAGSGGVCGTAPVEQAPQVYLRDAPSFSEANTQFPPDGLVAPLGEHLIACGCDASRHAAGCRAIDVGSAEPIELPPIASCPVFVWGASADEFYFLDETWNRGRYRGGIQEDLPIQVGWVGGITGVSTSDVFILDADDPGLWHLQDGTWRGVAVLPKNELHQIQAVGSDELWAIAAPDSRQFRDKTLRLVHFRAGVWQSTDITGVKQVASTSASDVWALGETEIYHFDGRCWSRMADPAVRVGAPPVAMRFIWTGGPTDVWVVGADNLVRRWDGQRWWVERVATASHFGSVMGTRDAIYLLEMWDDNEAAGRRLLKFPRTW